MRGGFGDCRRLLLLLAAYIAYESALDLWSLRAPEHSIPGIVLAFVSLVVMPLLSRASEVGLPWAAPPCTRTQSKRSLYVSVRYLAGWVCCSTPSSVCGGLICRGPRHGSYHRERRNRRIEAKPARMLGIVTRESKALRRCPKNVVTLLEARIRHHGVAFQSSLDVTSGRRAWRVPLSCPSKVYTFFSTARALLHAVFHAHLGAFGGSPCPWHMRCTAHRIGDDSGERLLLRTCSKRPVSASMSTAASFVFVSFCFSF